MYSSPDVAMSLSATWCGCMHARREQTHRLPSAVRARCASAWSERYLARCGQGRAGSRTDASESVGGPVGGWAGDVVVQTS